MDDFAVVAATIITVDMFQLITVVSSLSLLSSNCCVVIAAVIAPQSSLIISVSYHHTVPSMRCDQNIMIVVMLVLKLNNESCKIKSTKINGNHILSYNTAWCCKSNTCTTYMSPKVL